MMILYRKFRKQTLFCFSPEMNLSLFLGIINVAITVSSFKYLECLDVS